jgi:Fungal Zn(2)-Cys(6) binuclear cluster domain
LKTLRLSAASAIVDHSPTSPSVAPAPWTDEHGQSPPSTFMPTLPAFSVARLHPTNDHSLREQSQLGSSIAVSTEEPSHLSSKVASGTAVIGNTASTMDAVADSAASAVAAVNAANASATKQSQTQQDPPRLRSSIACWRCRRSKVKCLNNGVNTPCRACVTAKRECTYPAPSTGDRSQRKDGREDRAMLDGVDVSFNLLWKPLLNVITDPKICQIKA